MYVSNHMSDRK